MRRYLLLGLAALLVPALLVVAPVVLTIKCCHSEQPRNLIVLRSRLHLIGVPGAEAVGAQGRAGVAEQARLEWGGPRQMWARRPARRLQLDNHRRCRRQRTSRRRLPRARVPLRQVPLSAVTLQWGRCCPDVHPQPDPDTPGY
jgi:hypothetical protein